MKENESKTQSNKSGENVKSPPSKGVRIAKVIFNTIINVLIVLVLITSLLIAVMALSSKSSGISTIFGYTIQTVESDSMKGTSPDGYEGGDFRTGDLIIGKATGFASGAEYQVGDIVTYRTEDTDGNMALIVHRIVDSAKSQNGNTVYQTWGDNREVSKVPDQQEVSQYLSAEDIASVFYGEGYKGAVLKGWGAPLAFLRTQQGFFFVVLLPMIIFFMYALIRVVLSATSYKKSKVEEDKDEAVKAAVAAALAQKEADSNAQAQAAVDTAPATPAEMTPEQMEQFKQFMEFQKMQKAQKDAEQGASEQPGNEG